MFWLTMSQPQMPQLRLQCKLHTLSLYHFWFLPHSLSMFVCLSQRKIFQRNDIDGSNDNLIRFLILRPSSFPPFVVSSSASHDVYCVLCTCVMDIWMLSFGKLTQKWVKRLVNACTTFYKNNNSKPKKQSFSQNNALLHQH